jgi:hypothetical protein
MGKRIGYRVGGYRKVFATLESAKVAAQEVFERFNIVLEIVEVTR